MDSKFKVGDEVIISGMSIRKIYRIKEVFQPEDGSKTIYRLVDNTGDWWESNLKLASELKYE